MGIMVLEEDKRKESMELFIKALAAAPASFITALSGSSFARHVVDGAIEIEKYIFAENTGSK